MKSSIHAASEARPIGSGRLLRWLSASALLAWGLAAVVPTAQAATPLGDQPPFTVQNIPGNVALALSVEYPTVSRVAHTGSYSSSSTYLGYFDPAKCYSYYNVAETPTTKSYFYPDGLATTHACSGKWSGNFLNWAATQTIDPFRWAMTGGYRVIDTTTETVLEKAWHSGQGGLYPDRSVTSNATIAASTPFSWGNFNLRIDGLGNKMRFTDTGSLGSTGVAYNNPAIPSGGTVYEVYVRVKVCDPASGAGGVEANCVQYGSNWKPEGLIQKYSNKMRFSVFGYLNDGSMTRDGGVLRARQKFVGPTQPVPGSVPVTNIQSEWDATTGIFVGNPDAQDATDTNTNFNPSVSVVNSGVMNYLNKFGEITPGNYKSYDPVSELYYATLRYLKNLGNVPTYTDMSSASAATRTTWVDGFPVITNWDDPIQYACQPNFVLGIGDINTHRDKNLPGSTSTTDEPSMPAEVSGDPSYTSTMNAITATDKVFALQGLSAPNRDNYSGRNNSAGIAGLAYDAHTRDIRPDLANNAGSIGQTVETFWVDVLENPFVANNQFYLAAKYGGFNVPIGYDPYTNTTALSASSWHTPNGSPDTNLVGTQLRPDNYFTGGRPDQMIAGLNAAFAKIASAISAYTTSFSTSLPQVAQSGNKSFSTLYDANSWTGEVVASDLSFDATTGAPSLTQKWTFTSLLAAQLGGAGWNTGRRIASWDPALGVGVAFRSTGTSSISAAQLANLDPTSYAAGNNSSDYLNYLRGDTTNEQASTATGSTHAYRTRLKPLGDIVGSKARPVGPPSFPFSDATNPGYSAFKSTWAARPTVVYFGANDGMLHAVRGDLTAPPGGAEMFAYIPSALYSGPTGTPSVNGLASLGNPAFSHHFMVNATPNVYDIDFARTPDASGVAQTGTPDWHSVLIGGLGKGGKSYYAIDVTDPVTMASGGETAVAGKVLWEFTNADLGYTYGDPIVVKTVKYGWVVILPSGYNNADGKGYFFVVNPRTGALLEKISTGAGSTTNDAGLAFANAFVVDGSDGTADAVYAGDLLGNLWRWDVRGAAGTPYPAPVKIATLADSGGVAQPVTSRPVIEVHPTSKKRFVMVGTGRLLDATDISSTQEQTFYAISDGTNALFNVTAPTGFTFPISRTTLAANVNVIGTTAHVAFDPTTQMGWYEDLGTGSGGIGWRITTDATTLSGSVAFAATLPNGSVCSPSGDSRVYGRDFATGDTTVKALNTTTNLLEAALFVPVTGNVTDLRYLSVAGKATLISGTDTGNLQRIEINPQPSMVLRRLNWRELQVVQ
jgi:type IV pilus assembly protein PilY1